MEISSHIPSTKVLFTSLLLAFSLHCAAQPQFQWAKGIQTSYSYNASASEGFRIERSANGSLYHLGRSYFCHDFNPETGIDTQCILSNANLSFNPATPSTNFISRYNATTEQYSWTRRHAHEWGYPIFTDSGFIYFTGFFQGTHDFDSGPGTYNLSSQAQTSGGFGADMFLAKYDTAYNLVWAKRVAKSDLVNYRDIRTTMSDPQGNVYILVEYSSNIQFVAGPSYLYEGTASGVLTKFDPAGNLVWASNISGPTPTQVHGITQDRSGNVIVCGYAGAQNSQPRPLVFTGTTGNISIPAMTTPFTDGFVAKYNASGAVQWVRTITGADHQSGVNVATDSTGNVFMVGGMNGVTTFDSSNIQASTFTAPSSSNINSVETFLVKYSSQGTYQWAKQLKTTTSPGLFVSSHVAVDADGFVYAGGYFKGSITLNPGVAQAVQYTSLSSNADAILVRYNGTSGQYSWSTRFSASHSSVINDLYTDKFRNLYATGSTTHTTNFNPGGSGGTVTYVDFHPLAPRNRAFLVKYFVPQATSVDELGTAAGALVHPNPTTGLLTLEGVTPGTSYTMLSLLGQRVASGMVERTGQIISLQSLPAATYLLMFTAPDGTRSSGRVVKQ